MTSRVIREGPEHLFPGQLKEIIISCDQMGCSAALNDKDIEKGGGLKKMGWTAIGIAGKLRHYCPQHSRD